MNIDNEDSNKGMQKLRNELDSLKTENRELMEELQESSQGTLALYSEIDSKMKSSRVINLNSNRKTKIWQQRLLICRNRKQPV